ncbi:MAG: prolipoprotein diacylglyceryl transferase [Bacillota bacterium]|nr:prolipoprotein diacylglyceryl transferase [Bacillota bacterium]
MHFFPDPKIFVSFGSLSITWYSLCILTGVYIAYLIAQRTITKWGYSRELLEDFAIPMLFIGILGARIYYVIFEWGYYKHHLNEIVMIWNGGLAIHGGLIAGVIFGYLYFKKRRISFMRMFDCLMPEVFVAQALGRWGNFMNQEAFGPVVPESYYDHFPLFIKERMCINGLYREPTFLYESVGNIVGFLFIYFVFRKYFYRKKGDCGFMYFIWYGVIRFFIEGLRTDSLMIGPLKMAQCISIAFIVIGVLGLFGVFHKVFHLYKKPIVLFDLDGTLIDSQPLIFETFRRTFKELLPEHNLSQEELYSFFGPTLHDTFSKYFDEEGVQKAWDVYQRINIQLHDDYVKPMPHAREMLDALRKQGLTIGIVSNKRKLVVEKGIKTCDLGDFDIVLGMEDLPKSKPDPSGLIEACNRLYVSHDDLIYVGDNVGDILSAKNMGAYSIGYTIDENQREALEKVLPCRMVDSLYELVDICKEERTWEDKSIW